MYYITYKDTYYLRELQKKPYLCPVNTEKIRLFFQGRKGLLPRIAAACREHRDIIWFHVASYGEFEEARPVIEATRARFPERKILMTVFSPTVYVPMQHYAQVDWVFYLPLDTPWNVRRFLDAVRPAKAIFTITDYWPFLLGELRRRHIDTYIMSVRVEPDSKHLKWWDFNYRFIFRHCYRTVMVQNGQSRDLLLRLGVPDVRVTGDPRMDRVLALSAQDWSDPVVDAWCGGEKVFVAGSTYAPEDRMVLEMAARHPGRKILLIPHEPETAGAYGCVRYTEYEGKAPDERLLHAQILIVDTVGMLSRLYRYGYAAYVGGSFTEGAPHSVIEPAAYGIPVAFGPNYARDHHCQDLIAAGAGRSISNTAQLEAFAFEGDAPSVAKEKADAPSGASPSATTLSGQAARAYCMASAGATEKIMEIIFG